MEDALLFAWVDGANRVSVSQAGPLGVLVTLHHGPTGVVVRLPYEAFRTLAVALLGHAESVAPVAVVEQVLQADTLPSSTSVRTAVRVVDALRSAGVLPTGGGSANT